MLPFPDLAWTIACASLGALLALFLAASVLAGEAARREALQVYRRLLFEKSLRDLLPTTRPAWETAARYAGQLSDMEEYRAAELLRRAADASRRKADRLEAVRRALAELDRVPARA
ncbi:MAG: hypothetical protein FD180_3741 [Planctomycetota bacterium]|nr:MAG: hypothetical protein FD180_3741 [Planctomycetota bacterium]